MKPSSFDNILKNVQEEDLEKRKKREDEALGAYLDMQDELNNSLFPDYTMEDYVRQGRREKDDKEIQEKESLLKNVRDIKKKQNLNKESSVGKKPSGDKGQSGNKEPKLSERELTLQALKKNIEEMQKEPEKKELTTGDYLPDVLAGLYNIYNFAQGSQQPSMKIGSIAAARKAQQEEEAARQGKLGRMQKLYTDYLGLLGKDKDELSAKDKAYLDYYNRSLELKEQQQKDIFKRQEESFKQRDVDRKLRAEDKVYKVIGDYEKHPVVKELGKQGLSFDQADELINQVEAGNQVALGALGTKMARAMGEVGVLTDTDVKRYIQAQSLVQKAKDSYGRNFMGQLSKETLQDIKDVTSKMKKGFLRKRKDLYNRYVKRAYENYGKKSGLSLEDIETRFAMPSLSSKKDKTITKKQYSPSRDKTKITYSDGSSEIFDGRK